MTRPTLPVRLEPLCWFVAAAATGFLLGRADRGPLAWGLLVEEGAVLDSSDPILELSPGGENPMRYGKGELGLSGLLPKGLEAKVQNSAYLLRERKGRGAVVLFAGNPVHRGCAPFTTRAFFNALFFGGYGPAEDDD